MKKVLCLLMLGVMVELPTVEAKSAPKAGKTAIQASSEATAVRKKRRNRQRKGFMWGLFRKRNACDCPKH